MNREGECTYVRADGATVIDYVLLNTAGWNKIKRFRVEGRTESDNIPLSLQIDIAEKKEGRKKRK